MSNPATTSQIGSDGLARSYGIPAFGVQWLGNNGTTTHTLMIFTDITKTPMATVVVGKDNNNETVNLNRTDRKRQLKFSATLVSDVSGSPNVSADALAVAEDLPLPNDIVSIGHFTTPKVVADFTTGTPIDSQIETPYAVLDDCNARFTPDQAIVVDFTVTVYIDPTGAVKQFAATS